METEHVKLLMQVFGLITEPVYEQILMPPLSSNTHTLPPRHSCELIPVHNFFLYSDFKASRFVNVSLWVLFHSTLHPPRGWATQQACPYKQTAPRLAAGHRLGNSESGRSRSLFLNFFFLKCVFVKGLQRWNQGTWGVDNAAGWMLISFSEQKMQMWCSHSLLACVSPLHSSRAQCDSTFVKSKFYHGNWFVMCAGQKWRSWCFFSFFLFLVKFCFFILFF